MALNKAQNEVSHFLRGLFFSIKNCVGKHIARAQASTKGFSSKVLKNLRSLEHNLYRITSSQSVLHDSPLDVCRVIPSRHVLLLS